MKKPRKLKRGLKDISPLFGDKKAKPKSQNSIHSKPSQYSAEAPRKLVSAPPPRAEGHDQNRTHGLNVFSPLGAEDGAHISDYLSSQIMNYSHSCWNLDVGFNDETTETRTLREVQRLQLSWERLETLADASIRKSSPDILRQPHHYFMNFDPMEIEDFSQIAKYIDKWIICLNPSLEGLKESYRWIKTTLSFNPKGDYYLLFDGENRDLRGHEIFEKFSEFISRELGLPLVWLGSVSRENKKVVSSSLCIDHLFLPSLSLMETPEKESILDFTQQQHSSPWREAI